MSFKIAGRIIEIESGKGLPNLIVRATDRDLLVDDYLGAATTDEDGRFEISYEAQDFSDLMLERRPDIFLRVYDQRGSVIYTTDQCVRYEAGPLEEFMIRIPGAKIPGADAGGGDDKVEAERSNFRQLLVKNPNHFGTVPDFDLGPVKPMQGNTKYEELRCLGFDPQRDLLEAIFDVKLPYGYRGPLCSTGSREYVRFYVDWNGDGDFTDADENVGMVSTDVHDIPDSGGPCRKRDKPLSYSVKVKLDPEKLHCTKPNLVKVRAILSWDVAPTPGAPAEPPVWGNVLEKWIQIGKRDFLVADIAPAVDFATLQISPEMLDSAAPISKSQTLSAADLEALYQGKDVPEHRYNLQALEPIVHQMMQNPGLIKGFKQDPVYQSKIQAIQAVLQSKSETRYEELQCVALRYDRDTLSATLRIKLPNGYSGNLCTDGSDEHVAFWAHVYDGIEQQCVWRYLGTASVNVHDFEAIPAGGLQYSVQLPYDFSPWKRGCSNPVVMKIRAVLSWRSFPSTTDPFEPPVWGNAVEALIQLRPEDADIPGMLKPYLWSIGEMAVESIAGNPYTTLGSSLGDGYANGPSVNGGYTALESPFGGLAEVSGVIDGAPENPAESDKLLYKVQYRKDGTGTWHDIDNGFRIWIRVNGVPSGHLDQVATGGYFKYQKTKAVAVDDDILAQWKKLK
jgi:hypothetical protein